MDEDQREDWELAKPFVRTAMAVIIFACRNTGTPMSPGQAYADADAFIAELQKDIGA